VRLTPTETQFLAEFGSRRRFILWIRLWGVRRSVSLSDLRQMLWRLTILKLIDMDDRRLMPRVFLTPLGLAERERIKQESPNER